MRGWLAHMSVKADLLFITQTFVAAGVEVMSLTAAYSLCVSVCLGVIRSLEYLFACSYQCKLCTAYCWYHTGLCMIVT